MKKLQKQVLKAAPTLLDVRSNALLIGLGRLSEAAEKDPIILAGVEVEKYLPSEEERTSFVDWEFFVNVGTRIFNTAQNIAYPLICGKDEEAKTRRNQILKILGKDNVTVVGILTSLLIAAGLAPAYAALAAPLLVTVVLVPLRTELCREWKGRLPTG